jgi:MFS superfamily sulfate permease-like transporter
MADLAGTYFDWNPHMISALAAQKADYLFGGGTIVLAFGLQLVSLFIPSDLYAISKRYSNEVPWIAVVLTAVLFFLLRRASQQLASRFERQIKTRLAEKDKEAMLELEERKKAVAAQQRGGGVRP